ncbi:MAG: hypothetical protein KIS76_04600 [Pyrinomonadaceae bacterium]|nr:hypothetical protein [Pyrinomonadaceae bacterium]
MKNNRFINKIAAFSPTGSPVLSVYLNTEPNQNGQFDFEAFVKKQISENESKFEEGSEDRRSFDSDAKKIREFLKEVKPSSNGVAIFASSGADLFETRQYAVPFEEDYFFVFEKPHLFPLARLLDQNPTYAIVSADTNSATIHVLKRGHVIESEEVENFKTSRTEQGGWSQMRYQRHIDNFHQQHAKEVINELEKIVRDEDLKQFVVAGDEKVIVPLLKDEMSESLAKKLAGTLRLNVDTPQKELFEKAESVMKQADTLADKEKIDHLKEQNYDEGLGVTGVEKTLAALASGLVQELYMTADFDEIQYHQDTVTKILKAYSPGDELNIPDSHHRGMIVDELIRRGIETAEDVRFIEDPFLLQDFGGVGALLRFRTETDIVRSATS